MLKKVQYQNSSERQTILTENKGLIFIEEQNIAEGNFLIFSDTLRVEDQIKDIKTCVDQLIKDSLA